MQNFKHQFIVDCPLDRVWSFYTDVKHLETITPKKSDLKVIKFTTQKIIQGQEIWCSGKIIIAKRRTTWHSKITYLKPYEYVDEMLAGPFKKWRHLHRFSNIHEKQTEVKDEIEFELPYGMLGKLFDGYAYKQLQNIFEYRKIATIRALKYI